jgi:hypothetical protein
LELSSTGGKVELSREGDKFLAVEVVEEVKSIFIGNEGNS